MAASSRAFLHLKCIGRSAFSNHLLINLKPAHHRTNNIGLLSASSFLESSFCRLCSTAAASHPRDPSGGRQKYGSDDYNINDRHGVALDTLSRKHREELATSQHVISESSTFADFPLDPSLIKALDELGYKTPFEIQTKTLGHTLMGNDVIGRAVTGSGKTLAFAIPIVHKIKQSKTVGERGCRSPRAIVVAPTRELCNQIYRSVQEIDPQVRCVALYGGDSYIRQESEIRRGVDVVCATPGRLNDHLERGTIDLKKLQFLCLDEADELLNPNFREQIQDLFKNSPQSKQVMMFSATMPSEIKDIARRYMNDPKYVDITSDTNTGQAPENIDHHCIRAPNQHHVPIVASLVSKHSAERCIVFLRTKAFAGVVSDRLRRLGLEADALHSDLSQSRREKILTAFRMGELKVLCATDVAARGLDIPEVDLVIQVEPPSNGLEFYIHRAGRTGRAGRKGLAVMLHSGLPDELRAIREISRTVKMQHIEPPENALEDLRVQNLRNAMAKMNAVGEQDKVKMMPLVEKLMSNEPNTSSLLAAALVLLSQGSTSSSMSAPSDERTFSRAPQRSYNYDSGADYKSARSWGSNNRSDSFVRSNSYRGKQSYDGNRRKQQRTIWSDDE